MGDALLIKRLDQVSHAAPDWHKGIAIPSLRFIHHQRHQHPARAACAGGNQAD